MMALLALLVLFLVPSVTLAILIRCGRLLIELRLSLVRLRHELRRMPSREPLEWVVPLSPQTSKAGPTDEVLPPKGLGNRLPRSIKAWMWLVAGSALICTVGVALFSDRGDSVGWLLVAAMAFFGILICPLCCLSWAYEVLQRVEKVQDQVEELGRRCEHQSP